MNNPQSSRSIEPWYRQFWPWFLISLPACAVIASLYTLLIAHRGADDLVVDDYYRDGLAINRQLEQRRFAEQAGISAQLHLRDGDIRVIVSGPVDAQELRLDFSHPIEADLDFVVTLLRASRDQYRARLPRLPRERWHWVLDAGPDSPWRLDGSLSSPNFTDAPRL